MAGEIVRAKASLKKITADILVAATDLSRLDEARSARTVELGQIQVSIDSKKSLEESLNKSIEQKKRELASLEDQFGTKVLALIGVDESKVESEKELFDNINQTFSLDASITSLHKQKERAESNTENTVAEAQEKALELEEIKAQVRVFEARLGEIKAKIVRSSVRLQSVLGAIEDAFMAFRRYESRIGQLSRETGFLLKYDSPEQIDK